MTYMAAEEDEGPPRIEPTSFDLIVVGTGLPESIIAAAAASAGKTVLQINPDPYYHSPFASLSPKDLISFLHLHSATTSDHDYTDFRTVDSPTDQTTDSSFNILPLSTRPLYSSVEVHVYSPEKVLDDSLQKEFNLDLAGPRVLFCADPMVDLIVDVDVQNCMSFMSVDTSYCIYDECRKGKGGGLLWNSVPGSRNAIFRDRSLSLKEKNQLMRFFKLLQAHYHSNSKSSTMTSNEEDDENNSSMKITPEDLETPFVEFLTCKIRLSPKLTSIILYAITMADYEQDNVEACKKDIVKTKVGIDRLMLYHKSVGRFRGATGAMLYPIYGQGELAHFFCRRAAIMGGISITQMPVVGLLVDKDVGNYKGVKLVTGQELFSHHLILAPTFVIPPGLTTPSVSPQDVYYDFVQQDAREKVVRGICITDNSFKPDVANCLVFYTPKSLCPDQMTSVRIFQLSSNVRACPSGMFVVYLSTICGDVVQGKRSINAAIEALFSTSVSGNSEDNSRDPLRENTVVKVKPTLLWSTLYIQELIMGGFDCVSSTPMPDGNLQYSHVVDAALKLFQKMYPDDEFFPKKMPWWNEVVENGACLSEG
ncbi:rab escort protein 1-like [Coffea eugenioides]|uniref:rab escort protein 1-like n=1 Tax=Coffea eugenioides TaxID=49369 RepID=UPI000F60CC9B|nr:rab escort protein 1-like [Coffea eugenioides]